MKRIPPAWNKCSGERGHSYSLVKYVVTQLTALLFWLVLQSFPVLLFSPALDTSTEAYSTQTEEIVSHGYVVVAIEHPYDAPLLEFADGHRVAFDAANWENTSLLDRQLWRV